MKERHTPNPTTNDSLIEPALEPRRSFLQLFATAIIPLLLLGFFFLPSANSNFRYAYRDVASYYYPLFEQIQKSWDAGIPPLWNPYVNLGQPLAGDPTASVFYPGKLLFFLSSSGLLSFALCFKLYLWLHVALAFYTASRLARILGVSKIGATISGMSYAFSGQIFFQYTNVVYLVGAAWAPLHYVYALAFFREKTFHKRLSAVCKLSAVLAITILGGEPQIVYLTLITSTIMSFSLKQVPPLSESEKKRRLPLKITLAAKFLISTTLLTFLLGAVQILPSMELVKRSTRANEGDVRSLWDIPRSLANMNTDKSTRVPSQKKLYREILCQDFSAGGRSESIYRFSVGPWRWLEFIFPNIGGRQYPQNSRWFEIFPEEISLWSPSLYFGIAPFTLALAAARVRRRSPTDSVNVKATWLALFGLLGALGGYGFGWLFHLIGDIANGQPISRVFRDGDPLGGVYWFLTLLVPKFAAFRYPAKLATLTAVGFSILAGIGWDAEKYSRRFKRVVVVVLCAAIIGEVVTLFFGSNLFDKIQTLPNPLFGPFQAKLAFKTTLNAFLQTTVALLVFSALLSFLKSTEQNNLNETRRHLITAGILIAIASDLYAANSWLVVVAPTKLFETKSSVVGKLTTKVTPPRLYRSPVWFPPIFQTNSSSRRIEERVLWDVETLYPTYPCAKGIAMLDVRGAFMEKEFAQFVDAAASGANLDEELAFLGVVGIIGPQFWTQRISPSSKEQAFSLPLDWRVEYKQLNVSASRAALFRHNELIPTSEKDHVDYLKYSSNELALLVTTSETSDLIIPEQYWPDWKVAIIPLGEKAISELQSNRQNLKELEKIIASLKSSQKVTLATSNPAFGFLRKTLVPKGKSCVVMSYSPKALYVGGYVSLLTWFTLALTKTRRLALNRLRNFRQNPSRKENGVNSKRLFQLKDELGKK